jgi:hypothetical protein
VDWFADNLNHQLPLYWSRYPLPCSVDCDAFASPSWDHSFCDICGVTHSTFGYFFPPVPLLDRAIAKAKVDGASGIIVVPRLVGSLWWPVLLAAALSPFVRLPEGSINTELKHCSQAYQRYTWNAVAFDFSQLPRPSSAFASPPCQCRLNANASPARSSPAQEFRKLHSKLAAALLQS